MAISGNAKKRHTPANGTPTIGNDDGDLTKPCEKCGAANPLATRFCVSCSHPFAGTPADEKTALLPTGTPAKEDAAAAHQEELRKLREQHAAELANCESANKQLQEVIDGLHADIARQADEDGKTLAKLLEERDQLSADVERGKARVAELNEAMGNGLNAQKEANQRIVELEGQIQSLQTELAAKPAADAPQTPDADDVTLQYELTAAKSQVESLTQELAGIKSQVEVLTLERGAAFEEIDRLRSGDLGAVQAEVDRLTGEVEATKARHVERFEEAAREYESRKAKHDRKVSDLSAKLATSEQQVTELTAQLEAARTSSGTASSATTAEVDTLKAELAKAKTDLEEMRAEHAGATKLIDEARAKLLGAKKLVDDANDKVSKAEAEKTRLAGELVSKDGAIAKLEQQVADLTTKLTAAAAVTPGAIPPAAQAELDRAKAELAQALSDKAEIEREHGVAINARDTAQANAKSYYENEFLKAEASLKRVLRNELDAEQAAHDGVKADLETQIKKLENQIASKGSPCFKRVGLAFVLVAFVATIVSGVMFRNRLLNAVGLGPDPVLIPTTSDNLQKFFMQSEPTCLKGKVTAPAPDTLGIVCEKYATDGECTDVIGCQIQLPSKYAKPGYRYLTSDVLRAFNYSSTDPTCVPEPQLASFQKVREDGLRIDYCNSDQNRDAFTYNAARNCYDYSKLCLVNPAYDTGKTK